MWKRKVAAVVVAGALLVPMMGAEGGCEEAPNTGEGQVDPEKSVTLQNTGKGRTQKGEDTPFNVVLRIKNLETGKVQTVRKELIGGTFHYNIDYNPGTKLELTLKVSGGASDVFDCKIYDGPANQDTDHGLAQATCLLYTAR